MNISNIEYFIEVANCRSILKAAENLFITPSALSQHIKNIENQLGVTLFYRTGRRFKLTYAGERYFFWAKKLVEMTGQMKKEFEEIKFSENGRIRVGFPPAFSKFITSKVLPAFKNNFPQVEIFLDEDRTVALQQMLQDNELDIILTNTDDLSLFPSHRIIEREEIALVVPKGHHLIEKAVKKDGFKHPWIDLKLCREENFILLSPNQYLRQIADKILHEFNITKPISIQLKNIKSVLNCVEDGLGITLLFDKSIYDIDYKDSIALLSFGNQPILLNFIIAHSKNLEASNIINTFIKVFLEQYK